MPMLMRSDMLKPVVSLPPRECVGRRNTLNPRASLPSTLPRFSRLAPLSLSELPNIDVAMCGMDVVDTDLSPRGIREDLCLWAAGGTAR